MGINNPIGDRPKDPYEPYKIRIEAIEKDKTYDKKKEPPEKKLGLVANILDLMKKALDFILQVTEQKNSCNTGAKIQTNLLLIRSFFEILKKEDRSQDIPFLNRLSEVWHQTLEESLQLKRHSPAAALFQDFLKDIQNYPPGEQHSFAYYLTEYTGQQWLPFPYMDLIQKIHREYNGDPPSSALSRWTTQVDQLLEILTSSE